MSTGQRRVNIFLKKFLTQQQMVDNFLDYLLSTSRTDLELLYPDEGVFFGGTMAGSSSDEFSVSTPLAATNGLGNLLKLDPAYKFVKFENALGVPYHVGLRFNEIFQETELNVRTGQIEYTFHEEAIGELGEPDAVVDNGSTLTVRCDTVCEAGVSHAGRAALVYLKRAAGQADAFFLGTVVFTGGQNKINTTHLLGQTAGAVSTDPTKYQVFIFGPTVRRNTDLSLDPNVAYLGKVTGAGSGNTPSSFDQTGMNLLIPAGQLGTLGDEVKSFLVGGGLISWDLDTSTLSWASAIELLYPNKPYNFTVAVGNVVLADGQVAYINATAGGGVKPLIVTAINSMPDVPSNVPIVLRRGANIYFRDGALELKGIAGDDTSGRINDVTQDLLDYIGATDESDNDPDYSSATTWGVNSVVPQGANLTNAVDLLNGNLSALANNEPSEYEEIVTGAPKSVFAIPSPVSPFSSNNTKMELSVFIDGRHQSQDPAGGTAKDYRKISTTQIEFTEPVPVGRRVTIRKEGVAYGGAFAPTAGKLWSDPVDASPVPNADISHDLGSSARRFKEAHVRDLYVNDTVLVKTDFGTIKRVKTMTSSSASPIAAGKPVAKLADGSIRLADSDGDAAFIGFSVTAFAALGSGKVLLVGDNLPGALTGLGFAPGDDIFIGETAGTYTNNPGAFTGLDDDWIRVGIADCADGTVSALATDLIVLTDVVARA